MMLARRNVLLGAGSLVAATVGDAFAQQQDEAQSAYTMLGMAAPEFSAPRYGGGNSTLSAYRGRVLLLAFGGLWCPPCIGDGPNTNQLASLAASHSEIEFLYLQCGPEFGLWSQSTRRRPRVTDAERSWSLYFRENHYDYPVAFDLSQHRDISHEFAIRWFPSNLIIDRDGVIRAWRTSLGRRGADRVFARARELAEEVI